VQQVAGLSKVVVIDGLDGLYESKDEDKGSHLVTLLASALKDQAVKLFFTSCYEPEISTGYNGCTDGMFNLHRIEEFTASSDVRTFYETRFHQLKASHRFNMTDCPSSTDVDVLTERTGHLFVYAATITKFISHPRFSPVQRLHSLHAAHHDDFQDPDESLALNWLYEQILRSAVTIDGDVNKQLQDRVKTFIETIIVLQYPLPFPSMASLLLNMDKTWSDGDAQSILQSLASVITLPANKTDPVEMVHSSFQNYVTGFENPYLTVSPPYAHMHVAVACLRIMNSSLCQDICCIGNFTDMKAKIDDLPERLDIYVPDALRYSCVYWSFHIWSAPDSPPLIEELRNFCEHHIIHWIEVLSLLGNLNAVYNGLLRASSWCKVSLFYLLIARPA
jgi:hypothetical protein